jgi:hypothetical protein
VSHSKVFASQGDFSSRVSETVVFYKDEPFYARPSQDASFHLDLLDFPGVKKVVHKSVHVDDEALYIGASRLGLFNHNGAVHLPSRIPARRYRYGTPPEFISTQSFRSGIGGDVFSLGFRAMLLNQYPTVSEALSEIAKSKGELQVAISRHFWIRENQLGLSQLQFKDLGPVLWVTPSGIITFVEKTRLSSYLTQCSRSLGAIIEEFRANAV